MKSFKILLVLLLASTLASNGKSIVSIPDALEKVLNINGSITGDIKGKNRVFITDLNAYRDTTIVKDGKFSFKSPFDLTKSLFINFECEMGYRPYTIVYDQPGTINVNLNLEKNTLSISGLETPALYNEFRIRTSEMYREIDKELATKYGSAYPKQSDADYNAIMLERNKLSPEKMIVVLKKQVANHPDAYATAYILADNTSRYPLTLQEEFYNGLTAKAKSTVKGKELYDMIKGTKNSAIGSAIPNFTLNNAEGKPISFDKFKGNYLLIDFWASWCGPCRASFPNMKKLYKAYHQNGLEIYSISVDKNKADWLKALAQEKLPWIQALDNGTVAKANFAVASIPNLFLISSEGKIIMEELGTDPKGGGPIEKKLEEIYGKKME